MQTWPYGADELAHGFNDGFAVAALVSIEPIAIIIFLEFIEEAEKVFWKSIKFRHFKMYSFVIQGVFEDYQK